MLQAVPTAAAPSDLPLRAGLGGGRLQQQLYFDSKTGERFASELWFIAPDGEETLLRQRVRSIEVAEEVPGECASGGAPAEASLSITLFIDANGAANGSCNPDDSAATVPLGAHSVQVCLAGNTGGNVDALDITVTYNDALDAGAPEVDCPVAGGGANCVDDNPNLNDGAAAGSKVGTGWSCTAFGTSQPKADASGPATGQGEASVSCNANVSSPSALLQNGLLATVSLNAVAAGTHTLAFGGNPVTGAASGISRQGTGTAECGPELVCAGATITVQ